MLAGGNNSREEKEEERTAGRAAMSGTTLKFKNLNSLSSSFKRYVLTTFSSFFLQEISLIRDFGPPYRRLSEDVRAQVLS